MWSKWFLISVLVIYVSDASEDKDSEENADNVTNLNQIEHFVYNGLNVDITLSQKGYDEECFLTYNNSDRNKVEEVSIQGVTAQDRSRFVSCRVTIGPINETLLGDWELCGKHVKNSIEYMRCQPVKIRWRGHTSEKWRINPQPLYNHVVNFGYTLRPVVAQLDNVHTCHIITPLGEDLVITPESDYPNLSRVPSRDNRGCSVAIGPITSFLLGEWTIYSRYSTVFGFEEDRLPMNLHLYDEDNPYEQAYNITIVPSTDYIINLHSTIQVEVAATSSNSNTNIENCLVKTPTGEIYDMKIVKNSSEVSFVDVGTSKLCRVSVGPITEVMLGKWLLMGKFSSQGTFTERQLPFNVIQEDPANPIEDERRKIEYMTEKYFHTKIGANHTITMTVYAFVTTETCHIRTPEGLQYTIMEGFNIPGITVIDHEACAVEINVSEELIGNWMLISRETLYSSTLIEKRQPFTIYVEEFVNASPQEVTIIEGNDLYVRLEQSTTLHDTCKLNGPNDDNPIYETDKRFSDTCGFIVKNVKMSDNGTWEIVYGTKIIYRAAITVNINARTEHELSSLEWIRGRPIDINVGPENAVYCKVTDPENVTIFETFGRCYIRLDTVMDQHKGLWKMNTAVPGQVLTENRHFNVNVVTAEARPTVITHVKIRQHENSVYLSCAVCIPFPIQSCSFREPSGQVFIANQGIGEDRYSFHGNGSIKSELHEHDCGLRIVNPVRGELGIWRCAILAEDNTTYYGFLTVTWPWASEDMKKAASMMITETTLKANRREITITEGNSAVLSCSIQRSIRYCYFVNNNGTVFNVRPGVATTSMEYVGAGLDAGECGIRLSNINSEYEGRWSCNVGLDSVNEPEQMDWISFYVQKRIVVYQNITDDNTIIIRGLIPNYPQLEYCRFVRFDGLGFTVDNVRIADGAKYEAVLSSGECILYIRDQCTWDLYPWTVVAKVKGEDLEVSGVSQSLTIKQTVRVSYFSYMLIWLPSIALILAMVAVLMLLGPKNHREWTFSRVSSIRENLRNSIRKKPLPVSAVNTNEKINA